jgi:hypothetical protein
MRRIGQGLLLIGALFAMGCAARRGGSDDLSGKAIGIETRYAASHATVFNAAARALVDEGYSIRLRDSSGARGRLITHPRRTWIECLEAETQAKVGHPGVEAAVLTEREGDSTVFRVAAQTLTTAMTVGRNNERVDLGLPLQVCTITAIAKRVDSILAPEKHAAALPAPTAPIAPVRLGDFVIADTQRFSVPGAGTGYRYRGPRAVHPDVYIYTGDVASFGTDTAAALQSPADEFLQVLSMGRTRGQFSDFEVRANAAARRDIGGVSLLVHRVVVEKRAGERTLDDYFHIALVGNNYIKVRTTFPRGAGTEADVEGFVDHLLRTLLSR